MTSVSVIIPAHDAADTIGHTLAGLAEQVYEHDWEVIVVDNGSSDDTGSLAHDSAVVSQVIRIDDGGAGDSRNAGVAVARGEVFAFLDSDCRPSPLWLSAGVAATAHADLVQGATLPDPDAHIGAFDRTLSVTHWTGLYETANLFVRRDLFDRLGGFQTWHGLGGGNDRPFGEDAWFGWSARRIGARTEFCETALAFHAVFPRGLREYVAERFRSRHFAELARAIPELREHFFYRRWFLSRRSASYDLALAAFVLAVAARKPSVLVAAAPYFGVIAPRIRGGDRRHTCKMLAAELAADSVGFASMLAGSLSSRSLLF